MLLWHMSQIKAPRALLKHVSNSRSDSCLILYTFRLQMTLRANIIFYKIPTISKRTDSVVVITKLNLLGGNLNLVQKSRTSLLSRRRSLDLSERSKILQIAVKNKQLEMVEILLPFADALALDTSLPLAMRNDNDAITELLIRYGASASQTADGQDAFRQAVSSLRLFGPKLYPGSFLWP